MKHVRRISGRERQLFLEIALAPLRDQLHDLNDGKGSIALIDTVGCTGAIASLPFTNWRNDK